MNFLAKKLAHLLAKYANEAFSEDEIRYGIEISLGSLAQIILIMLVALLIGIWQEVSAIIITAVLYRRYSGGPHCSAYYRCTITSLLIFVALGCIAGLIPAFYLPTYMICLFLLSAIVIYIYVPVDNPVHLISNESIRKKYQRQSYIILLLLLLLAVIAYLIEQNLLVISILLGLLWQNFTLIPPGQAFIKQLDRLFDSIELLFKRKEGMKCSE